jgi:hypothetical protein
MEWWFPLQAKRAGKGGFLMMKTLLISLLAILAPFSIYAQAQTFHINNVPVEGVMDYRFGVAEVNITDGNFDTGPVMSYIATAVTGEIILDRQNNVLDSSLQSGANFTMAYMSKKFNRCNVMGREISKTPKGQAVKYLFRTFYVSS